MKQNRFLKFKFSILQACYWGASGTFCNFMYPYLLDKGITITQLGIMNAIYSVTGLLGLFFLGTLSDILRTNKKIYLVSNILLLGIFTAVFYAKNFIALVVLYAFLGMGMISLMSILDTWILKVFRSSPQEYGQIRAVGSLVFAVITAFFGKMLTYWGYSLMLYVGLFMVSLGIIVGWFIPDIKEGSGTEEASKYNVKASRELFEGSSFVSCLLLFLLMGTSIYSVVHLLPAVIVRNIGGSLVQQGLCCSICALVQVPFMCMASRKYMKSAKKSIELACLIGAMGALFVLIAEDFWLLYLGYALFGACIGILLPAKRQLVFSLIPFEFQATAQSLSDVSYNCVAGIVGSLALSVVAEKSVVVTVGITLVLFVFAFIVQKKLTN